MIEILRDTNRTDAAKFGKFGSGGINRTTQIEEICIQADIKLITLSNETNKLKFSKLAYYLEGLRLFFFSSFKLVFKKELISKTGLASLRLKETLLKTPNKIIIIEEPVNSLTYYWAKKLGFKIISLPHNFETLMSPNYDKDYFTKEPWPHTLVNEIKNLKKSDIIFCISREEQWFLNANFIPAQYLAYYPPKQKENYWLKIREKRQDYTAPKTDFLIISSKGHYATKNGTLQQINWIKNIELPKNCFVHIVGYNTDYLSDFTDNNYHIKIHGTVSPEKLEELTISCKALLIHQNTGVGALTKIPEILIAGMPIIANFHAARSFLDCKGVHPYDDFHKFEELLKQELEEPYYFVNHDSNQLFTSYIKEHSGSC